VSVYRTSLESTVKVVSIT